MKNLIFIIGVPGGNVSSLIPIVSTYNSTSTEKEPYKYCSSGYIVHDICIMTSADLHGVSKDLKVISVISRDQCSTINTLWREITL